MTLLFPRRLWAGFPRKARSESSRSPLGQYFRPSLEMLDARLLLTMIHWSNPNGGFWNDAANWDLNRVPGPGDDVVIDLPGPGTVTLSFTPSEIQSLTCLRPLTLDNAVLWVHGRTQVENTFYLIRSQVRDALVTSDTTIRVDTAEPTELADVQIDGRVDVGFPGHVIFSGSWRNRGIINLNGGMIDFGGTFPTAAIGDLRISGGGKVRITGMMDNTGDNLALDDATGSWSVYSGQITGGTVTTTSTTNVEVEYSGRLSGVTINGNLVVGSKAIVTNGLTVNGRVTMGGDLFFQGMQTFSGAAAVVFGATIYSSLSATENQLVTLAPSVTVLGSPITLGNFVNQGKIKVIGAGAACTLDGFVWRNEGDLVLSEGTLNLRGTFPGLGHFRRNGGTVNLVGSLENAGNTFTLNAVTGSWRLVRGRIHGGVVTSRDGATLIPTDQGGALDGVTLTTNLQIPVGTTLSLEGAWVNRATLTVAGGKLDLGGIFDTVNLGTIIWTAGSIGLSGTLDNMDDNLILDAVAGSWNLEGGTIIGGTVTTSPDTPLTVAWGSGRLDGVTMNGNLNLVEGVLSITNGLTLNGTLTMGSGNVTARVNFEGTQTLAGQGTVLFGNSPFNELIASSGVAILDPGITVEGGFGRLANITNRGTIETATPDARIILDGNTWQNEGVIRVSKGNLVLSPTFNNAGIVSVDTGGTLFTDATYTQTDGATYLNGGAVSALRIDLQGGLLAGVGTITGRVLNAAHIEVGFEGQPGSLVIQGDYTQTADGALALKIGGTDQGTGYDYLSISGTATLDGTLDITVLEGFYAQARDTFTLLTFGQRQGEFGTINGLYPEGQDVYFDPVYEDTNFTLLAVPYGAARHSNKRLELTDRLHGVPAVAVLCATGEIAVGLTQMS